MRLEDLCFCLWTQRFSNNVPERCTVLRNTQNPQEMWTT